MARLPCLLIVVTALWLLCVPLVGCSAGRLPGQKSMSFAAMQMLNEGVDGDWILAEYPDARQVERRPDGSLQRLTYWVNDPQGQGRGLVMHFDETGTLTRKDYGGPVVRPPDRNSNIGFGGG